MINAVPTPSKNATIFQGNGVIATARDSGNSALSSNRNVTLTPFIPTPSQNSTIFQGDGKVGTSCNSRNIAVCRRRNVACTELVGTPSKHRTAFQSDSVGFPARYSRNTAKSRIRNNRLSIIWVIPCISSTCTPRKNRDRLTPSNTIERDCRGHNE